jgi:hypothetical protein
LNDWWRESVWRSWKVKKDLFVSSSTSFFSVSGTNKGILCPSKNISVISRDYIK